MNNHDESKLYLKKRFNYAHQPLKSLRGLFKSIFIKAQQDEVDRLSELIVKSEGCSILVSGYRGVGKTTIVNQTLLEINDYYKILSGKNSADFNELKFKFPPQNSDLFFTELLEELIAREKSQSNAKKNKPISSIWATIRRYFDYDDAETMSDQLETAIHDCNKPEIIAIVTRATKLTIKMLNKRPSEKAPEITKSINDTAAAIKKELDIASINRKYTTISISLAQSIEPEVVVFRVIRQLYQEFKVKLWRRLTELWMTPTIYAVTAIYFYKAPMPYLLGNQSKHSILWPPIIYQYLLALENIRITLGLVNHKTSNFEQLWREPRLVELFLVAVIAVLLLVPIAAILTMVLSWILPMRRYWGFMRAFGQAIWNGPAAYGFCLIVFINYHSLSRPLLGDYFYIIYPAVVISIFILQQVFLTLGVTSWYYLYAANKRTFVESTREAKASAPFSFFGLSLGSQTKRLPYKYNDAEDDLIKIINSLAKRRLLHPEKITPIFLFDELDKISLLEGESQDKRKKSIESAISSLKMLFTEQPAFFIFVAGRDATESWMEDQAKGEGLYESIFCQNVYIPSLLTKTQSNTAVQVSQKNFSDQNILASNIILLANEIFDVEEIENNGGKRLYMDFCLYLAFKSRGIFRKFLREVYAFVEHDKKKGSYVNLTPVNVNRVKFYSYIQSIVEENFDTIVGAWDDRARVSTYYLIEHILKFYQSGFNWNDVGRAPLFAEKDEPNPTNHVLNSVLKMLEGRIIERTYGSKRNFKFDARIKKEIQSMANMLDEELVEFQFIKSDFEQQLNYYESLDKKLDKSTPDTRIQTIRVQLTIGGIYSKLQDHARALEYFGKAVRLGTDAIDRLKSTEVSQSPTIRSLVYFVAIAFEEIGFICEKQQQYEMAILNYSNAVLSQIQNKHQFPTYKSDIEFLSDKYIKKEFNDITNNEDMPNNIVDEPNNEATAEDDENKKDKSSRLSTVPGDPSKKTIESNQGISYTKKISNVDIYELIRREFSTAFPTIEKDVQQLASLFSEEYVFIDKENKLPDVIDNISYSLRSEISQNPELTHSLNFLAYALAKMGQKKQAEYLLWIGLVVLQNKKDDVGVSTQVKRIGDFYYLLRRLNDSEKMYGYVHNKISLPVYIRSENYSDLGNLAYAKYRITSSSIRPDYYRKAVDLLLSLNYKNKSSRTLYKRSLQSTELALMADNAPKQPDLVKACENLYDALTLCRLSTKQCGKVTSYKLVEERKYALICLYIGNFCLQVSGKQHLSIKNDFHLNRIIARLEEEIKACFDNREIKCEFLVENFFTCKGSCNHKTRDELNKNRHLLKLAELCFIVAHDILKDYINIFDKAFLYNRRGHLYYKLAIQNPCEPIKQTNDCPTVDCFKLASDLMEEARKIYAVHENEDPENLWAFADTCVDYGNIHFKMFEFKLTAIANNLTLNGTIVQDKAMIASEWLKIGNRIAKFYHQFRLIHFFKVEAKSPLNEQYINDIKMIATKWFDKDLNGAFSSSLLIAEKYFISGKYEEALKHFKNACELVLNRFFKSGLAMIKEDINNFISLVTNKKDFADNLENREFCDNQLVQINLLKEHLALTNLTNSKNEYSSDRILVESMHTIEDQIRDLTNNLAEEVQTAIVSKINDNQAAFSKELLTFVNDDKNDVKNAKSTKESPLFKLIKDPANKDTKFNATEIAFLANLYLVMSLVSEIDLNIEKANSSYLDSLRFYSREYERYQQSYPVRHSLYYFRDDFNDSDEHWKQSVHYKKRRRKSDTVTIPATIAIKRARKYIYSNKPILATRMLAQLCSATSSDDREKSGTIYFETFTSD